jgi:DNA-binding transcriptional MerR regulator
MEKKIPGTSITYTEQAKDAAYSVISPIIEATGGISLSQLSKITGLEASTIQNWIKRGWVSSTKGKKYFDKQVTRILLINMMRGVMKLEDIANIMIYINGDVEDTSDDIIPDIALYNLLCKIIFLTDENDAYSDKQLSSIIDKCVAQFAKTIISHEDKLKKALMVMVLAYRSGFIKNCMESKLAALFEAE